MSDACASSLDSFSLSSSAEPSRNSPVLSSFTSDCRTQAFAGPSTWRIASHPTASPNLQPPLEPKGKPKAKSRTVEELDIIEKTSARFLARIALDHSAVTNPDVDMPFSDTVDAIKRLLPYHIFQQPTEDLELFLPSRKGKAKASESDLKREIEETKFALECFKRRVSLRNRYHRVLAHSGKRASPSDQSFVLAQAVLEAERADAAALNSELRAAKAELERLEREKRASMPMPRTFYYASTPTAPTSTPYYRTYPYAYSQAYGATVPQTTTMSFALPPAPTNTTENSSLPAMSQQAAAIPVQLPVASLPALHALGIIPVPIASIPPGSQPQTPAILRGSTSNGTMLSLEINVSLLQSAQMSGLAVVLNSLMARSSSGNLPSQRAVSSEATPTPISNGN